MYQEIVSEKQKYDMDITFIITRYAPGKTLSKKRKKGLLEEQHEEIKASTFTEKILALRQIAESYIPLHQHTTSGGAIIHSDFKYDNYILNIKPTELSGRKRIDGYPIDFGVIEQIETDDADPNKLQHGNGGTFFYCPPEVLFEGIRGVKSDIYSLVPGFLFLLGIKNPFAEREKFLKTDPGFNQDLNAFLAGKETALSMEQFKEKLKEYLEIPFNIDDIKVPKEYQAIALPLKAFLQRMSAYNYSERPDIIEVFRFFNELFSLCRVFEVSGKKDMLTLPDQEFLDRVKNLGRVQNYDPEEKPEDEIYRFSYPDDEERDVAKELTQEEKTKVALKNIGIKLFEELTAWQIENPDQDDPHFIDEILNALRDTSQTEIDYLSSLKNIATKAFPVNIDEEEIQLPFWFKVSQLLKNLQIENNDVAANLENKMKGKISQLLNRENTQQELINISADKFFNHHSKENKYAETKSYIVKYVNKYDVRVKNFLHLALENVLNEESQKLEMPKSKEEKNLTLDYQTFRDLHEQLSTIKNSDAIKSICHAIGSFKQTENFDAINKLMKKLKGIALERSGQWTTGWAKLNFFGNGRSYLATKVYELFANLNLNTLSTTITDRYGKTSTLDVNHAIRAVLYDNAKRTEKIDKKIQEVIKTSFQYKF
jgi:serine/threonine protein kinase